MEAEVSKYQIRLEEIEKSMQLFEKKTEIMKKKMKDDMMQLMKDYAEKESVFEEERRWLQEIADRCNKDLLESRNLSEVWYTEVVLLQYCSKLLS